MKQIICTILAMGIVFILVPEVRAQNQDLAKIRSCPDALKLELYNGMHLEGGSPQQLLKPALKISGEVRAKQAAAAMKHWDSRVRASKFASRLLEGNRIAKTTVVNAVSALGGPGGAIVGTLYNEATTKLTEHLQRKIKDNNRKALRAIIKTHF